MTARRETTAARREAILNAALRLFTTRGFRATSIEEIRAASGASNGSLYHHFGSKEGIAAALYADAIEDYQRGALAVFTKARSVEAAFRGCVEHYLHWVEHHRDLALLMLAVEHTDVREVAADRVATLNEAFRAEIGAWMDAAGGADELPELPRDLLLPAVLGPARRFAELWLEDKTQTAIAAAARVLAEVSWHGLVARTPHSPAKM